MPSDISTRRALEVVLSRVRMHDQARDALVWALHREIEKETAPPEPTTDTQRALLVAASADLAGTDLSFPKTALLGRIWSARDRLQKALTE